MSNDESEDISGNISASELDEMKLERDQKSRLQKSVEDRRKRLGGTSLERKNRLKDKS